MIGPVVHCSVKSSTLNLDDKVDDAEARRFAGLYQNARGASLATLADINGDQSLNGLDGDVLTPKLLQSLWGDGVVCSLWKLYGDLDLSGQVNRTDLRLF